MQEDAIRQRLASRVAPEPSVEVSEPKPDVAVGESGYAPHIGNSIVENNVFDYYQIAPAARLTDAKPKLEYLLDWAGRKTNSRDELVIMQYLKQYDSVFMIPPEKRFEALYKHAKMDDERERFWKGIEIYGTV